MASNDIVIVLFEGFEPLDAVGPVEALGDLHDYRLRYASLKGGLVSCRQNLAIQTESFESLDADNAVVLIPGGMGTRILAKDSQWLSVLKSLCLGAQHVLTVCTGSVLLARTGLLDGRAATTNKNALDWAKTEAPNVRWQSHARWVVDANIYTSSGVSAGIDMALAFIEALCGKDKAEAVSRRMEYIRNSDPGNDPFSPKE